MVTFFKWTLGIIVFGVVMTLAEKSDKAIEETQKVECVSNGGTFIKTMDLRNRLHNMCEFK